MRVALIGAGGHAQSVWDLLDGSDLECWLGYYVDDQSARPEWLPHNVRHIHDSVYSANLIALLKDQNVTHVAVGIGGTSPQRLQARFDEIVEKLIDAGFTLPPLVSRHAHVSRRAHVESGAQVMPGASVRAGATVARGAIVNTNAVVDHGAVVGEGAHVAPGAVVLGDAVVGTYSMVGANAVVLPEMRVPPHSLTRAAQLAAEPLVPEPRREPVVHAGTENEIKIGDRVVRNHDGRTGVVVELLQDGEAEVRFDDGLGPSMVNWNNLSPALGK